jgi:deazaflavin-dependent oxidoreductase (nitroreductase family)
MAYLKPGALTRKVFNPLVMKFNPFGTATIVVRGRKSGNELSVPVIAVEHEGARYLVSTRGESDWVKNLRAAGRAEIRRKGQTDKVTVVELPIEEREPVIAAYRAKAGKEVERYFKQLPDPADHPVFRLEV